jgi:hypothetical protein
MMNDRFSARFRQYLVDAANEQPADGQLEAVLRRTSTAPQHRSWVARLGTRLTLGQGFRGHGRLVLVLSALVVALAAGVAWYIGSEQTNRAVLHVNSPTAVPTSEPTPTTVFEGTWTSTDAADGSTQTLVVERGRSPEVHFQDDFSISCERRGEESTRYVADGTGEVLAGRLTFRGTSGGCGIDLGRFEWFYDFDEATDTLIDYQEIVWTRSR